MNRQSQLRHQWVQFIPEKPEQGTLYISQKYKTAVHICCCGCGLEVVTPLNPAKWSLTDHGDSVSLFPSIGNWSFPCKSHYWIRHNKVMWARGMSAQQIARVRENDHFAVEVMLSSDKPKKSWWKRLLCWLRGD